MSLYLLFGTAFGVVFRVVYCYAYCAGILNWYLRITNMELSV